jgi:DNA-directed RNA polymerase specialized sigma24 family protein
MRGFASVCRIEDSKDLEAVDEALSKLAAEDPAKAEVVKLRFFAGLTMPEIAKVRKISLATTERHWTYARTWLHAELSDRVNSPHGAPGHARRKPTNEIGTIDLRRLPRG